MYARVIVCVGRGEYFTHSNLNKGILSHLAGIIITLLKLLDHLRYGMVWYGMVLYCNILEVDTLPLPCLRGPGISFVSFMR